MLSDRQKLRHCRHIHSKVDVRENTDQDIGRKGLQIFKGDKETNKIYKTEPKKGDHINGTVKLQTYSMY